MNLILSLILLLGQDGVFDRVHHQDLKQPLTDDDITFSIPSYPDRDFIHLVGLPEPDAWHQPREWVPAHQHETFYSCSDPSALLLVESDGKAWCWAPVDEKDSTPCATAGH